MQSKDKKSQEGDVSLKRLQRRHQAQISTVTGLVRATNHNNKLSGSEWVD